MCSVQQSQEQNLSLSTSTYWNMPPNGRFGNAYVEKVHEMGFRAVEFFGVETEAFDGLVAAFIERGIRISSLHNICPSTEADARGLTTCFLASASNDERRHAIELTKRTIDRAADVGALAVVVHVGSVCMEHNTPQLVALCERYGNTGPVPSYRNEFVAERKRESGPYLDRVHRSLDAIDSHAAGKGIKVGLETRYYHEEIPNLEEFVAIFNRFPGSQLCYWHDVGHAQSQANLGFYGPEDYLKACASRMVGMHIHDVVGLVGDHRPCGAGNVDFAAVGRYMKGDLLKVIEFNELATVEEVLRTKKYVENVLNNGVPPNRR